MIPAIEWWAVLQRYNEAIFPAQILLYLLAVGITGIFLLFIEMILLLAY